MKTRLRIAGAFALAAALGAAVCEIYTDVDGVFSADPRVVPTARRVPRISYEEMLDLAATGAKVLHVRCVEYAALRAADPRALVIHLQGRHAGHRSDGGSSVGAGTHHRRGARA